MRVGRNLRDTLKVAKRRLCVAVISSFFVMTSMSAAFAGDDKDRKATLDNGMTVVVHENGGDLAAVCIYIKVGAVDEDKNINGITALVNRAALACHPVGGANPPALRLEQLGGRVEAKTSSEYTRFSLVVPVKNLGPALKVLSEAISRPDYSDAAIGIEKGSLATLEDWRNDRLVERAYRLFIEKTYLGMPYGLGPDGDPRAIGKLGRKDLAAWHDRYYRPDNMTVSICGRVSLPAAVKMVTDAFGKSSTSPSDADDLKTAQRKGQEGEPLKETKSFRESVPPGRAAAVIGYTAPPIGSADYPAMRLIEAALSEGMGSLIFKALRDDNDLAYSFGCHMPSHKEVSRLAIYVTADEDKLDAAVKGIQKAVEKVRTGGLTKDELERARGQAMGALSLEQETALDKAEMDGLYEFMGLDLDYSDNIMKDLAKLDKHDVSITAGRYLSNCTIVLLKPPSSR